MVGLIVSGLGSMHQFLGSNLVACKFKRNGKYH